MAQGAALVTGEPGIDEHFIASMLHLAAGRLQMLRDDPAAAVVELERAVEVARRGASVIETAAALVALGDALRASHDASAARVAIEDARTLVAQAADPGRVADLLAAAERATAGRGPRPARPTTSSPSASSPCSGCCRRPCPSARSAARSTCR